MQFTIQFTEAEDGGVLASTLRRIAAAFDPSAQSVPAAVVSEVPAVAEVSAVEPIAEVAPAHVETVTKTRRTRSTKAAVDVVATPEQVEEVKAAVNSPQAIDSALNYRISELEKKLEEVSSVSKASLDLLQKILENNRKILTELEAGK